MHNYCPKICCFLDRLISRTCIRGEIILYTNTQSIYYWSSESFRKTFHNKTENPLRNLYFVRFKGILFLQKCQCNLCASQWSKIHKKNKKEKKINILYHIGYKVRFQKVVSFISRKYFVMSDISQLCSTRSFLVKRNELNEF